MPGITNSVQAGNHYSWLGEGKYKRNEVNLSFIDPIPGVAMNS